MVGGASCVTAGFLSAACRSVPRASAACVSPACVSPACVSPACVSPASVSPARGSVTCVPAAPSPVDRSCPAPPAVPVVAPPVVAPPVAAPPVVAPPVVARPVVAPPVATAPVAAPPVATAPVAALPVAAPAPVVAPGTEEIALPLAAAALTRVGDAAGTAVPVMSGCTPLPAGVMGDSPASGWPACAGAPARASTALASLAVLPPRSFMNPMNTIASAAAPATGTTHAGRLALRTAISAVLARAYARSRSTSSTSRAERSACAALP